MSNALPKCAASYAQDLDSCQSYRFSMLHEWVVHGFRSFLGGIALVLGLQGSPTPPPFLQILRDNIQGITKPAIRRLARRGGVKRISGLIYEEVRGGTGGRRLAAFRTGPVLITRRPSFSICSPQELPAEHDPGLGHLLRARKAAHCPRDGRRVRPQAAGQDAVRLWWPLDQPLGRLPFACDLPASVSLFQPGPMSGSRASMAFPLRFPVFSPRS